MTSNKKFPLGAVALVVLGVGVGYGVAPVSYTHLRAHET